ncbi:DUF86 domain-containing protein [Nocardioides carbamazepini]|uniref:HepT-like ribonuclease domain-containing protein n=1 Tax=Nocardioides carbamazepini TaxID=2854259 RepID=UPI002149E623|nr:DUF86 domain-containing protein [Nocardioides carbamazepini]MCR1784675.1 DUF86 domain-containing protein [Nocardioides carbamazepini]
MTHRSGDGSGELDRTATTLADFLEFAALGARLVDRGKDAYDSDEMLRLASEALLHKIGEAVIRLERVDPDLVAAHPEVRWRAMKGTRNRVAHDYGAVDYEIIWAALADRLPEEADHVRRILDEG